MSSSEQTTVHSVQPRRRALASPLRRLSRNVLIIGTVLALASAFGPLWLTRVGLVVAIAAAVVACLAAWQEVAEARASFSAEMLRATRAHSAALTEERRHNAAVLDTLTARILSAVGEAAQLQGNVARQQVTLKRLQDSSLQLSATISSLRGELQSLRGEHALTCEELRRGQELVEELQQALRSREAELEALTGPGTLRSIPRRVLAEPDHPQVRELSYETVVLPNYEGERKLA